MKNNDNVRPVWPVLWPKEIYIIIQWFSQFLNDSEMPRRACEGKILGGRGLVNKERKRRIIT